jgi:hypothetical protein
MLAQLPTGASSTTTTTVAEAPSSSATEPAAPLVLKLRGKRTRRLRWADDVVDNEDLDRKKSKCCCIFHPSEREADDGWRDRPEQHPDPCPEHDEFGLFAPLELPPLDGGDGGGGPGDGDGGEPPGDPDRIPSSEIG